MLRTVLTISGAWVGGDIAAQFFEFRRKFHFYRNSKERITKYNVEGTLHHYKSELDIGRTVFNGIFGLFFSCPLLLGYQRLVIPRVFGNLERQPTPSLLALGVHQLFLTPTILFSYFTFMTACKGGFRDTSFMDQYSCTGALKRHSILSIQSYIFEDVLPFPLLSSWGVLIPAYSLIYRGGILSSSLWSHAFIATLFMGWCGLVSFTQASMLL